MYCFAQTFHVDALNLSGLMDGASALCSKRCHINSFDSRSVAIVNSTAMSGALFRCFSRAQKHSAWIFFTMRVGSTFQPNAGILRFSSLLASSETSFGVMSA